MVFNPVESEPVESGETETEAAEIIDEEANPERSV
jgi:hypothetical protein